MMNLESIAQRIKAPQLCEKADIEPLKELSEKYPYAQIFPLLYLKTLANNNDIRFEEELLQYAYRIHDRSKLFELIEKKEANSNLAVTVPTIEQISPETSTQSSVQYNPEIEDVIETQKPVTSEEYTILTEDILETPIEEILEENETKIEPDQIAERQELNNPPSELTKNTPLTINEIQADDLATVLSEFAIEDLSFETEIPDTIEQDSSIFDEYIFEESEENLIDEEKAVLIETEIQQTLDPALEENNIAFKSEKELYHFEAEIVSSALSGSYDLSVLDDVTTTNENSENNFQEEVPSTITEEIELDLTPDSTFDNSKTYQKRSFSSWLRSGKETEEKPTGFELHSEEINEKEHINHLVDQFIQEEPSISRITKEQEPEKEKTEFFSPVKKAKLSLDENRMPVSETLAKIFVAQGNFPKAIFTYEQLILVIPEKKTFFANQIEKLKQKLNT